MRDVDCFHMVYQHSMAVCLTIHDTTPQTIYA